MSALRVMVVEEDDGIGAVIREVLADEGFSVLLFRDASAALDHAVAEPPDVVVFDLHMRGPDGHEFHERLQSRGATCALVLCSGWRDADKTAERIGAVYLPKPFDIEEYVEAVREAAASCGGAKHHTA
jgi:DNA-binding response OmpR family regulator